MLELAALDPSEDMLQRVAASMPLVADLCRADAVLYRLEGGRGRIVAHARPHSVPPYWRDEIVGAGGQLEAGGPGFRALQKQGPARVKINQTQGNLVRVLYPVNNSVGQAIGLLAFDRTLIQEERQRLRKPAFRHAIGLLQEMAAAGQIHGAERTTPFREHDGVLVVNRSQEIQYASGVATSLYSRAGFMAALEGLSLEQLQTQDSALATRVMTEGICVEEAEERAEGHYWVKKAVPLIGRKEPSRSWRRHWPFQTPDAHIVGAILTIHDETEERRRARELKLQSDMLLELQHRVRNSLQTLTSLMRLQARRAESQDARAALEEAIYRIHHVAAVHEFLFDPNDHRVNLRKLTERLVDHTRPLIPPPLAVQFHVEGSDVYIPGERATQAALIVSELLLNAIEHGFQSQTRGNIWIHLAQQGDRVEVEVRDDGQGAPDGFEPDTGLSLVSDLTINGLNGEFSITNDEAGGALARVAFSSQAARRSGIGN